MSTRFGKSKRLLMDVVGRALQAYMQQPPGLYIMGPHSDIRRPADDKIVLIVGHHSPRHMPAAFEITIKEIKP